MDLQKKVQKSGKNDEKVQVKFFFFFLWNIKFVFAVLFCCQLTPPLIVDVYTCVKDNDKGLEKSDISEWRFFKNHHYKNKKLHARCCVPFVAIERTTGKRMRYISTKLGHQKKYTSDIDRCFTKPPWREHRLVTFPAFQGIGIGSRLSDVIGEFYHRRGIPYVSKTFHPFAYYRDRSCLWHSLPNNHSLENGKMFWNHSYYGGQSENMKYYRIWRAKNSYEPKTPSR